MHNTLFVLILLIVSGITISYDNVPRRTMNKPAHHTENGFINPHDSTSRGFREVIRWQLGMGPDERQTIPENEIPSYSPTFVKPELDRLSNPDPTKIQITWIGHATFLIQVAGLNILTDPIFSERSSPVSFIGPKRFAPPGIPFDDLPEIHVVVISHNHYDHLDLPSVEKIGNKAKFFVPLRLMDWFKENGIENVIEMDWWQNTSFKDLNFHCVPAQHFSGRSLLDRDKTLWAGWVIETHLGNIYFAGDTGYSPDFLEIGKKFNPIKVAMIPIGAYKPRWFMGPVHVDPPQAVQIHQDLGSERSIGMHWGTFDLADEAIAEPPIYLKQALKESGSSEEEFIVMAFGQTIGF